MLVTPLVEIVLGVAQIRYLRDQYVKVTLQAVGLV